MLWYGTEQCGNSSAAPLCPPAACNHETPSVASKHASHIGFAAQGGHVPSGRLALLEGQVGRSVAKQIAVDGAGGMGRRVECFC